MSTTPPITGSISHGTLRSEDLLPAFLATLGELDRDAAHALAFEVGETLMALFDGREGAEEDAGWLMERLDDRISEVLPPGWYFGTIEGDGADFGIWQDEEYDERADMDEALEYIRGLINAEPPAEGISMGQIAWLVDHAAWIDPDDVELLQWAEVPEEDRYRPGQGTGKYLDTETEEV